jgi:hypothetical protein
MWIFLLSEAALRASGLQLKWLHTEASSLLRKTGLLKAVLNMRKEVLLLP